MSESANLFSPLTIRSVTFRNRIAMSPMCQYSSEDGFADDWHLVHLGSRAAGGVGLVIVEATAVTADGRITPGDMGLWSDAHAEPLGRVAKFVERMGAVAGIQLAHAGRKASCARPFHGGQSLKTPEEGGWTVVAPSPIPFHEGDPVPVQLDQEGIDAIVESFVAATKRALDVGFRVIEIHSAHGYLLSEFLSPLTNHRTDHYGGSLENRMRLVLQVAKAIRAVMPDSLPLFTRISVTDWVEGGWDLAQSTELAKRLKDLGVDLIDCSSGAVVPYAKIPVAPGFQVPFAEAIRRDAKIMTGAVGMVTEYQQADNIIRSGKADLALIGRELLREPYWALKAAEALGHEADWPIPYGYAVKKPKGA